MMNSLFDDDDEPTEVAESLKIGDEVTVHFTSTTLEGGVLERSHGREPLRFRLGASDVVAGLTDSLIGRAVGDRVSVRLSPDNSFGYRRSDWLVQVPLSELPDGVGIGDQIMVTSVDEKFPAWVQKTTATDALLDANHPLVDETTLIEVDIVAAQSAHSENLDQ